VISDAWAAVSQVTNIEVCGSEELAVYCVLHGISRRHLMTHGSTSFTSPPLLLPRRRPTEQVPDLELAAIPDHGDTNRYKTLTLYCDYNPMSEVEVVLPIDLDIAT
jgi:hypothetical protein